MYPKRNARRNSNCGGHSFFILFGTTLYSLLKRGISCFALRQKFCGDLILCHRCRLQRFFHNIIIHDKAGTDVRLLLCNRGEATGEVYVLSVAVSLVDG